MTPNDVSDSADVASPLRCATAKPWGCRNPHGKRTAPERDVRAEDPQSRAGNPLHRPLASGKTFGHPGGRWVLVNARTSNPSVMGIHMYWNFQFGYLTHE